MAIKYIDDLGPDGAVLGQTSAALVGFYGKTPVDQPAAITSATNTATNAATAVNAVLARLRELGLIAT